MYQVIINLAANAIKSQDNQNNDCIDAFTVSSVLALIFATTKEKILSDIIKASNNV